MKFFLDWKTEVLAASIRHPIQVIEVARAGADVATMPFKVMQQLIKHPLTDKGLDQFSGRLAQGSLM